FQKSLVPDCPPPFFSQPPPPAPIHLKSGTDPPPVLHGSTHFQNQRFRTTNSRLIDFSSAAPFSSGSGKILSEEEKAAENIYIQMPHRTRPMTALLVFTGLNAVLVSTITPVYDFVCFLPFWERRRERRRLERETSSNKFQSS
ncbi:hypothetical protein ES288_D11G295000v1, partial [Gossypium darwinii]